MTFQWTLEVLNRARELWNEGLPPGRIGAILGTSRNSVIGKAYREKFPPRGKVVKPAAKVHAPPPAFTRPSAPPMDHCQWIEGDPKGEHTYCGKPGKDGGQWCSEHHARVYVPGSALQLKKWMRT